MEIDAKFLNTDERKEVKNWATVHSNLRSPLLSELADFILIILYTGMRPFEVCELSLANVEDLIERGRTRISGKTGERDVFGGKHEDAGSFFTRLRDSAHDRAGGWNLAKRNKPVMIKPFPRSTRAYRRAFHQLQSSLGFPKRRGLHCLRRAAGKTFQESNQERDLNAVKQFLGHRNTKTTELYLQDHGNDIMAKCDTMNAVAKRKLQEQ
ncbi:hypothetical protein HDE_12915 [Halotydeus destructor]|nr:hypothetical protein HDE_12915 [Halotydeus destructor]